MSGLLLAMHARDCEWNWGKAAEDYGLGHDEIEVAQAFYNSHKDVIDARIKTLRE